MIAQLHGCKTSRRKHFRNEIEIDYIHQLRRYSLVHEGQHRADKILGACPLPLPPLETPLFYIIVCTLSVFVSSG